jgi:bifunctional DNA-binding transcriptional regulator/antitoxin component of YhaV-PrlF toxin-antitoxin module
VGGAGGVKILKGDEFGMFRQQFEQQDAACIIVEISKKRRFTIPKGFYDMLGFKDEADCFAVDGVIILRPKAPVGHKIDISKYDTPQSRQTNTVEMRK